MRSIFLKCVCYSVLCCNSPKAVTVMVKKMPTERVEALFKLASQPAYIKVPDFAFCSFNGGSGIVEVSSSHSLNLMDKISNKVGFGDSRYNMVWLHGPHADDPCEVAVLVNLESRLNKKLFIREVKPMPGSINKNHLTFGLVMQSQGGRFFSINGQEITFDLGNEAHQWY